ncbi:sigma factor-like helix-turn-helix DNA-binding protein, partial [Anaerosporobacter sp.]
KIQNTDHGCMFSYLATSIHNNYIKNLINIIKIQDFKSYSELTEKELYYLDALTATNDQYLNVDYDFLEKFLTKPEFIIIKMIFYEGFTVTETANANGITRQAVNQMKNRALNKLKTILLDKR